MESRTLIPQICLRYKHARLSVLVRYLSQLGKKRDAWTSGSQRCGSASLTWGMTAIQAGCCLAVRPMLSLVQRDISLKVRLRRCWNPLCCWNHRNPLFAKVRTHQRTGMFSGSWLHHHEPFISSASAVPCSKLWNEPYEWESVEWIQCVNLILGHLKRQEEMWG